MLANKDIMAFLATTQSDRARQFYSEILGLSFIEDTPYALVFAAGRTLLRVQKVQELTPLPFTSLGWAVSDIADVASQLTGKGISCVRFEGLQQDMLGIWQSPNGDQVAWFRDPDGNTISLTQFA